DVCSSDLGMQIDGATVSEEEDNENVYYTFKMDELSEILYAHTQYEEPAFNLDHDVDFRFQIENMDDVPVENDQNENTEDPNNENNQNENTEDQTNENDKNDKTEDTNNKEDNSDNKGSEHNRGGIGQNKETFLNNRKQQTVQQQVAQNGNKQKSKPLDRPEVGHGDGVNGRVVNDQELNPQPGDYS